MTDNATLQALEDLQQRIGARALRDALALAEGIGVKAARKLLERAALLRLARSLLDQNVLRAEAQAVLRARLGVSRATAYRALSAALNHRRPGCETSAGDARAIEPQPNTED